MTLDPLQRYFYRQAFEIDFLKKEGTAFEDFFADIMEKAHPEDFVRVRPYGNEGDKKCDGYIMSSDSLFAVYAPREMKQDKLIAKMNSDFSGALVKWGDKMQEWTFVHNDKDGFPPTATQLIRKLKSENKIEMGVLGESRLKEITMGLSLSNLEDLFGIVPTIADLHSIDFQDLRHVIQAIQTAPLIFDPNAQIKAPSPEKIKKNDLSPDVALFLSTGRQREQLVADFIDMHPDPLLGERIAQEFHNRYASLRDTDIDADTIFQELLHFAGGLEGTPKRSASVLAVLAYLFERCDIFEDPDEEQVA